MAEGTSRAFLLNDRFTGKTIFHIPDIALADQITPPSGTYKTRAPTFTWTTSYPQGAFRLYVFDGNTLVHDSGKITGNQQSYTLPSGVLQPTKSYRIRIKTWDNAGQESWYSSSSIYVWDPRSFIDLTATESAYVRSQYPTSTGYTQAYLITPTSLSNYENEAYVKFDLSPVNDLQGTNIWGSAFSLTRYSTNYAIPTTFYAHEVSSNWSESTLTWNNRPTTNLYTVSKYTLMNETLIWDFGSRIPAAIRLTSPDKVESRWHSRRSTTGQPPTLRVFYSYDPDEPKIRYPDKNLIVRDQIILVWEGSDPDTAETDLSFDLEYRFNGGQWTRLATDLADTIYKWNLTNLPGGPYEVRIRAYDGLTYSDWSYFPAFQINRMEKPTVSIAAPAMAGVYPGSAITVSFTYTDPDNDPMKSAIVEVARNSAFTADKQSKEVTATSTTVTVDEGTWYVRVRARDATDQWSDWSSTVMFTVDKSAPEISVALTSPRYTSSRVVTLSIDATDAISKIESMQVTTSTASPGSWIPFQQSYALMLPVDDGHYDVYVRVRDKAHNTSSWQSVRVTLDTTPPVVSRFVINDDAPRTDGMMVVLHASAADELSAVTGMQFSNDGINWSNIVSYQPTFNWTMAPQPGTATVYARFYDSAGNMVEVNDSILYMPDNIVPEISLVVNEGQPVTYSAQISVRVLANDNATPQSALVMRYSIGADNWSAWVPYSHMPFVITLPAPGTHMIYAQVQDANGNTNSASAMIHFALIGPGTTPPDPEFADTLFHAVLDSGLTRELVSMNLFGETVWVTQSSILRLKGSTDGKQYSVTGNDWVDVQGNIVAAVPQGPFSVWIRYRLDSGIYSAPVQYKFLLDTTPPAFTVRWGSGATATTTGAATLEIEARDNVVSPNYLTYEYSLDGGHSWTVLPAGGSGATGTVHLGSAKGQRSVLVRVTDLAGNSTEQTLMIWNL